MNNNMKRKELVNKLIKEGFSEKTLVNFSDKQLGKFANMFITETLNISQDDQTGIQKAKQNKEEFNTYNTNNPNDMTEKWDNSVKIKKTGVNAKKTQAELKKELSALKARSKKYQSEGKRVPKNIIDKESELEFALRAKQGWKGEIKENDKMKPIGKTKSGKSIYPVGNHPEHANFTKQDHKDAISLLDKLDSKQYGDMKDMTNKRRQLMYHKDKLEKLNKSDIKEEKPSAGLTKKQKSSVVKKARKGGDIGKKGKNFKDVEANAKKYGARNPEAVAASAMWKSIRRESVDKKGFKVVDKNKKNTILEWVDDIAEKNYSNLTLKSEIMEMVTTKMHAAKAKQEELGIPEFMTYDSIVKSGAAEPATKPVTKPTTKPTTRPKPRTPYQPGPGTNPKPKAMGKRRME